VIAVPHGHYDHLGETVALCRAHERIVLAITEMAWWLKAQQVGGTVIRPMNKGGGRDVLVSGRR
jgi:L-ascorbate metabolism protein UlaG (beta-lactamase superfamily)